MLPITTQRCTPHARGADRLGAAVVTNADNMSAQ
jgi:hypothetical protein